MGNREYVFQEEAEQIIGVAKGTKRIELEPGDLLLRFDAAMAELPEEMRKDSGDAIVHASKQTMAWLLRTYGMYLTISEFQIVINDAQAMVNELKKSSLPTPPSSPSTESTPNEQDSLP